MIDNSEKDEKGSFDINASIRIIRHISGGIYRNPATAMRELIINGFDAGAHNVWVKLEGKNKISQVTISDDGDGLTKDDMVFSFTHVGSSLKKLDFDKYASSKRPIVGQFGVGLLAAAHASTKIEIETTPKDSSYTLKIQIDLSPFFEYEKQIETLEEFTYGSVTYDTIENSNKPKGTVIVLKQGDEPESNKFWRTINDSGLAYFGTRHEANVDNGIPNSANRFEAFNTWMDRQYHEVTIRELRGYEQFIWQLGLILPVQYVDDGPIRKEFIERLPEKLSSNEVKQIIEDMKKNLKGYDFHVYVDDIELKKPIMLPSDLDDYREELAYGEWNLFPITYKKSGVLAKGYIFFQPYRVRPMELRGIYARLNGVGVGQYDNTLVRALRHSTTLPFQISGELDLEKGFNESLNLDRSGFIETDGAYIDLMDFLSRKLEKDDDSILNQIGQTKQSRRVRQLQEKKGAMLQAVEDAKLDTHPNFKVEVVLKNETKNLEHVDSDYVCVKISYKDKYIAVTKEAIENPTLVKVLLAVDRVIRERGIEKRLADEIKDAVRKALTNEDSAS